MEDNGGFWMVVDTLNTGAKRVLVMQIGEMGDSSSVSIHGTDFEADTEVDQSIFQSAMEMSRIWFK